jgi:hypothetical protein
MSATDAAVTATIVDIPSSWVYMSLIALENCVHIVLAANTGCNDKINAMNIAAADRKYPGKRFLKELPFRIFLLRLF